VEERHLTRYVVQSRRLAVSWHGSGGLWRTACSSIALMVGHRRFSDSPAALCRWERLIRDRQQRIRLARPTTRPAVICVEAGPCPRSFADARRRISHHHTRTQREFHLVNLEMRAGKPARRWSSNLACIATGVDTSALVATLVTDRSLRTSVSTALRGILTHYARKGAIALKNRLPKYHKMVSPLVCIRLPASSS